MKLMRIAFSWIFIAVWIYALIQAWDAGIGWFIFWLVLGPFIIATVMGFLGMGQRRN